MPWVEVREVGSVAPRDGSTTVVVVVFEFPLFAMATAIAAPARTMARVGSSRAGRIMGLSELLGVGCRIHIPSSAGIDEKA
jgi:hypothetical protein